MNKEHIELFKDKIILVTGGIGSIGFEIVNQLSSFSPKEIRVFDNRETELFYMSHQFGDKIFPIFGDVRDRDSLVRATKDVNIIFHAAAMKHVLICEWTPFEAVKTNVIGTQNIIECAIQNNVERMVMISTDKAVNPTNVMGATKLLTERLVSAVCNLKQRGKTKFSVVRFGNVLASRGSVLEIWEKQLGDRGKITVTDPNMTRFFMSIPASVELIFNATYLGEDGETFIFKMPSVRIGDLAEVFLELKGCDPKHYVVVDIKPGEKRYEELINKEEEHLLLENEKMFVRLPTFFDGRIIDRYKDKGFVKPTSTGYSSNDPMNILKREGIKNILEVVQLYAK